MNDFVPALIAFAFIGAAFIYGYITECHRNKAPEAFASLNLRNIYSFGMNYFISGESWPRPFGHSDH